MSDLKEKNEKDKSAEKKDEIPQDQKKKDLKEE